MRRADVVASVRGLDSVAKAKLTENAVLESPQRVNDFDAGPAMDFSAKAAVHIAGYSEFKNTMIGCFSASLNRLNALAAKSASPAWRAMAFGRVSEVRSCM